MVIPNKMRPMDFNKIQVDTGSSQSCSIIEIFLFGLKYHKVDYALFSFPMF